MDKAELIDEIAKVTCGKEEVELVLAAMLDAIKKAVNKGDSVTLGKFGTFCFIKKKARIGRNPMTGAAIKIPAKTVPVFKAGKDLKDAVKKDQIAVFTNQSFKSYLYRS
jgi:DNA-binding protein HU-beta